MKKEISLTIPKESGFTHVLFNIAAQGFEYIEIHYSGGGDDGAIDNVYLVPNGVIKIEDDVVTHILPDYGKRADPDIELRELLRDKAYEYVLENAEDWWNNDGGGGTLYISTQDGSYYCKHYVYETITHDSILTGKFGD